MRKPVRIALVSLATLAVSVVLAGVVVSWLADRKMHRSVTLPPLQVTFATTAGQLDHGEYLFNTRGCMECHGADGGGHVVIDDKESGFFVRAPNITSGGASPARDYIAQACTGCHGAHFSGGKIPGTPPSWPDASNLTAASDSAMSRYTSAEQFKTMFRTGSDRTAQSSAKSCPSRVSRT